MNRNSLQKWLVLCLSVSAMALLMGMGGVAAFAETYQYTIESGDYEIEETQAGTQEIKMEGFGRLLIPGKPNLPSRIFTISIPPEMVVVSVDVEGIGPVQLDGTYQIAPAPSHLPGNGDPALVELAEQLFKDNYSASYESDEAYPESTGEFVGQGGFRKYNLVDVRFTPFSYTPKTGILVHFPQAIVTIEYEQDNNPETGAIIQEENIKEVEDKAQDLILNYDDAQQWYPPPAEPGSPPYEFVIVTTEDLEDSVWPIKNWEICKGRGVYVATTEDISSSYSGADLAEKIRNFLRANLSGWGILKVLLVGDLADVPMRYCRTPDPWGTWTTYPTDYYYAELSSSDYYSWNADHDSYYGERGQDSVDFVNEVDVGRIPWSDPDVVEAICLKMADYEYSSDTAYKKNVLLPEAFWDEDTDNAVLADMMWNNFYSAAGYTRWRLFEYGPHWYSTYTRDATMTHTNVVDDWSDDQFGSVCWSGHGSPTRATYDAHYNYYSFIESADNEDLNDAYPSVIYSNSCSTAYPENADNLGRQMLRLGGVAFVGSVRVMAYMPGWDALADGWGNTLAYLFSQKSRYSAGSSIGYSHQQALRDMYTTYGWGNEWSSMFEYVLYGNPDLWIRARPAALPNLTYNFKTDWPYPIVPRSTAGCTDLSCPVTTTLPGNTSDTYLNWSWQNDGSVDAPSTRNYHYLDGTWYGYSPRTIAAYGVDTTMNWDYGPTITGGRHTLWYEIDEDEWVWETDETDNCWCHQFVWSPYALADDTPIARGAAPHADAWGCCSGSYYNNDGFSFYVGSAWPNKYWSAVGVLPYNPDADYDVRLWDIGDYTGSEAGFGGGYLEWSTYGGSASDFVIVNNNTADTGTYTAGAINRSNETGNFHIEEATSTKIYAGSNGTYSMSSTAVLDIYEYYISTSGDDYGFKLEQTSGTCDLGMSLYDDETEHCTKSEYMTGGYANSGGDGADESMQVTIPDAGYHGLVIWKVDASDYSKTASYNIKVGKCATPSALSSPSPADGATDVSVDADLDWADSADTEFYQVWFKKRENSSWDYLGSTETSSWALGTLDEATTYDWWVRAENICGGYAYDSWSFTTEDNTAPTPNPMTWLKEPYETSMSVIAMVATTATDPLGPITYRFECTGSPTGGTGGTSSSWISSTSYTDSGLSTNHQYGYRVYAKDGSGNSTSAPAINYDFTDIESSTGITFGTITATSIQARSTNTPTGLTRGNSGLNIYNDTNSTSSGWKQNNDLWNSGGLTPNTSYSFRALSRNGDANATSYSPTGTKYTLANLPTAGAFSNVTDSSIQANWSANGNPAGTQYYCENTTAGTNSGWITDTAWTDTGLNSNTGYSFRVKARNGDGVETGWRSLGSETTLAAQPGAAAFSNVTQESIQANWTANGNPAGTEYYCENTTAGTNSGWITDTAWNSTGLNCNTSYDFRVKARNSDLVETAWVSLGSRSTRRCGDAVCVVPFIQLLLLN